MSFLRDDKRTALPALTIAESRDGYHRLEQRLDRLRQRYPDAQIYVFHIDIRSPGRLEDFYQAVQEDEKVTFIKGKVAKISEEPESKDLTLDVEDTLSGENLHQKFDMVVLATPAQSTRQMLTLMSPHLVQGVQIIIAAKGFESETDLMLSDVVKAAVMEAGFALKASSISSMD